MQYLWLVKPDVWYKLPLPSLGVYNVRNKPLAVALADIPGYSDSTLYTALDVFRNRKRYEEAHANPLRKQYHERRDDSDKLKLNAPEE